MITAGGRSQTVTDTQIASPMPGDIHSMKHWKLSKMRTPESSPVIFQAKPCALTGRKKRRARSIEAQSVLPQRLWACAGLTAHQNEILVHPPTRTGAFTNSATTNAKAQITRAKINSEQFRAAILFFMRTDSQRLSCVAGQMSMRALR